MLLGGGVEPMRWYQFESGAVRGVRLWQVSAFDERVILWTSVIIVDPGIKIAMPRIGCGLDRLEWGNVRRMIKCLFADTDVEILVCYQ